MSANRENRGDLEENQNEGNNEENIPLVNQQPKRYPLGGHRIFSIVKNGKISELEDVLKAFVTVKSGNENLLPDPRLFEDKNGKTPLHHACYYGDKSIAKRMVEILLQWSFSPDLFVNKEERKELVRYKDNNKKKALNVAVDRGYWDIVLLLVSYGGPQEKKDKSLFNQLFAIYPNPYEVLYKTQLDTSVMCFKGNPNHAQLTVSIDFESITGNNEITLGKFLKESSSLYEMVRLVGEKSSRNFMLHPTIRTFLRSKLDKMKWLVILSFLFHIIWLGTSTTFLVYVYVNQCPFDIQLPNGTEEFQNNDTFNHKSSLPSSISENPCRVDDLGLTFGVTVFIITFIVALWEVYEFLSEYSVEIAKSKKNFSYLKQKENIGQWILIVTLILTMPMFSNERRSILLWQYYPAAIAIILSWTLILSQLRKVWRFGLYVEMMSNVFNHFIFLMITFSPLLIGFCFGFKMLVPQKFGSENFFLVLIKIFVMMTGEIGYNEMFDYNENAYAAGKLITLIFVAVVTLILLNLIIGLTVSEIQDVRKNADMHNSLNQLGIIYHLENFIFSGLVQRILRSLNKPEWMQSLLVTEECHRVKANAMQSLLVTEECHRDEANAFCFVSTPVLFHIEDLPSELQPEMRALAEKNYICDEANMRIMERQK